MTTTMFFRNQTWTGNDHGKWQTGTDDTTLAGVAQGWSALRLHTSRGSAATTKTRTSVAGPTNGVEINATGHWNSAPLASAATITGNITFNLRMAEAAAAANAGAQCVIERLNNLGQVASTIINSERGTELGTTEAAENWSATPTSTTLNKGDRIRVRVAANDAGGTMAAGQVVTFWLDGLSGATGDSYITFTENLSFATAFPTPATTLYLTDTASDIDPGGGSVDTKEAWTSRGGGTATAVVNTTTGFVAPIRWTKTAGGNQVEWYTKQLSAFTLGGVVQVTMHGLESNAAANVSPRTEIAICDAAGTLISVWGANTVNNELGTSDSATTWNVAGDDTAVADSNRLRIRMQIDDTESAAMATAFTATLGYAGSAASTGDTFLVFGETLTEFSTAPPAPIGRRVIRRNHASQRASRW